MYGFTYNERNGRDSKQVILNDVYEKIEVVFSCNTPEPHINDEVRIIGKACHVGTHTMIKDSEPVKWMQAKYGQPMTPFKITIFMNNDSSGDNG